MTELSDRQHEIIDYVLDHENKIQRQELKINNEKANNSFLNELRDPTDNIASWYSRAMAEYRASRESNDPELSWNVVWSAYNWINKAKDYGCIDEGDGLIGKLDDCKRELIKIQNELTIITPKFEQCNEQRILLLRENERVRTEYEKLKMQIEKK